MPHAAVYKSYAKINLYLDVLPRRNDGFHDIETVFQTVDLSDTLTFERRDSGIALHCDAAGLPTDASNLVVRAAGLLQEYTGTWEGADIRLEKRIPVAAGMAGGSGNAAAALVALNALWELGLGDETLSRLALKIGSDVPYCLRGGTVAATGRGEVMTPLAPLPETWFILVHPELELSTAAVYNSPLLEKNSSCKFDGMTQDFRDALHALERADWGAVVFNRMETAVFPGYPDLRELSETLLGQGCMASAMSGSGPTVFGVCRDRGHAEKVGEAMTPHRTSVVRNAPVGVEQVETW